MLYEDQATNYDERAGLPSEAVDAVAHEVSRIAGLNEGEILLEIGTGTGLLSLPLVNSPVRYIGFDRSPAMLDVFRQKLMKGGLTAELLVADGNDPWPASDGSVGAVFSSRALHHLEPGHVVAETLRVLRPGGWLITGRVRRPADSPKSLMRHQMRQLLKKQGFGGRSNEDRREEVFSHLEQHGGTRIETVSAAHWTRSHTPAASLLSWEGKDGLAGEDIPSEVKERLLTDLREWAEQHYGSLEQELEQEEWFELDAIRIGEG